MDNEKVASSSSSAAAAENVPEVHASSPDRYLTGWRLGVAIFGLSFSLFLPVMEVSIVSTSLITISKDLDNYNDSSWLVTSYLLAFTGFLIIWAKLSDILGLKSSLNSSLFLFIAFSAGCGGSQSMTALIVNRALQGLGGAGVYSLALIAFVQVVPPSKYAMVSTIASSTMALGLLMGPLIGGAINRNGVWRWVFFINIPAGLVCMAMITLAFPNRFPNHSNPSHPPFSFKSLRKLDVIGAIVLLGANVFLVTALSEGQVRFSWNSGIIISFFVVSGILWIAFFAWEKFASRENSSIEPMFPSRFLKNRVWMGVLIGSLLNGAALTTAVIELPQRFQIVNKFDPLDAGIRLLAFAAGNPVGGIIGTSVIGKRGVPFVAVILIGTCFQTVGFALLSTIPTTVEVWGGIYGYCILAGIGTGSTFASQYMMAPLVVAIEDKPVAVGSVVQLRMLGGAIGIAIANTILNSHVRSALASFVAAPVIDAIFANPQGINTVASELGDKVRSVFGDAFNLQMKATIAFCAAQFLSVAIMWQKKPLRMTPELDTRDAATAES